MTVLLAQMGTTQIAIAGLAAMIVLWAVLDLVKSFGRSEEDKIKARLAGDLKTRDEVQSSKAGLLRSDKNIARNAAEAFVQKFEIVNRVQRMLEQADMSVRATSLLMVTGIISLVLLILPAVTTSVIGLDWWIGLILAPLPFIMVLYVIGFKVRGRRNKFVEQMPDAFEMMVQSLRAGHALTGAIQVVGEQMPAPIGQEFARVFQEQNLGKRLEDALRDLTERIDAMDVKFFVSAVIIQRQTGGDLAEVLEKITELIRQRIELFGMVKALTAEGRLSGWVLLSLPIVCLIATLTINPGYFTPMYTTDEGKFMLLGGAVAMLIGMALIKKIVTIEV